MRLREAIPSRLTKRQGAGRECGRAGCAVSLARRACARRPTRFPVNPCIPHTQLAAVGIAGTLACARKHESTASSLALHVVHGVAGQLGAQSTGLLLDGAAVAAAARRGRRGVRGHDSSAERARHDKRARRPGAGRGLATRRSSRIPPASNRSETRRIPKQAAPDPAGACHVKHSTGISESMGPRSPARRALARSRPAPERCSHMWMQQFRRRPELEEPVFSSILPRLYADTMQQSAHQWMRQHRAKVPRPAFCAFRPLMTQGQHQAPKTVAGGGGCAATPQSK